jgi:hypothetical protein
MRRFSEMSALELESEMSRLWEEKQEAEAKGWESQAHMLARKYYMAMSYTLTPDQYRKGAYHVVGESSIFELTYLNGVMAWGQMNGDEISLPISMLSPVQD